MESRQREFEAAFEQHSDSLFRHASLRLSDRERAIEIVQETFVRAWDYIVRGQKIENYRSFLFRLLNNMIIDEYRKKKSFSLDAMVERAESETFEDKLLKDESVDIIETAAIQFDAKRVLLAMEELSPSYKQVLVMRYIDALSPSEIAQILGESENVVSVRLHRAVRKLRDRLTSSRP